MNNIFKQHHSQNDINRTKINNGSRKNNKTKINNRKNTYYYDKNYIDYDKKTFEMYLMNNYINIIEESGKFYIKINNYNIIVDRTSYDKKSKINPTTSKFTLVKETNQSIGFITPNDRFLKIPLINLDKNKKIYWNV
jgi:hypothetical protein